MARRTPSRRPLLVLASGSPRRAELLERAGFIFQVAKPAIDESLLKGESPARYVGRLSREKVAAVAPQFDGAVLIAADTTVVLGKRVLGKPEDARACVRMMAELSAKSHEVLTGVTVLRSADGLAGSFVVRTRVEFDAIPAAWAKRYAATAEPYDKAGGYGLQGAAGAFIQSIRGSVTNVVGLPMVELLSVLDNLGYPLPWSAS